MCCEHKKISLGFTDQRFSPGVHICQIFRDDLERDNLAKEFLLSGLTAGERATCFSEYLSEPALRAYLASQGVVYDTLCDSGALALNRTNEVYFADERFEPERMLSLLRAFFDEAMEQGYPAARVIGEMTTEVQHVQGGSRLLEYEAKVSLLQKERPVTAMCQYDARQFDGATIMDILKVHPLMVVRGAVVHNPFFIKPEEFLPV